MKHVAIIIVFLLLNILSFAQSKIHLELGKQYAGLRKDQIKIGKTIMYETKAMFTYQNKKYAVIFNKDSTIKSAKQIIPFAEMPDSIREFISCVFSSYNVLEAAVVQNYENGLAKPGKDYMIVFGKDGSYSAEMIVYQNGKRPQQMETAQWVDNYDYELDYHIDMVGRDCGRPTWYGGSVNTFCDSVQKYIRVEKDVCLKKFSGIRYGVVLAIDKTGKMKYLVVYGVPPHILRTKLEEYFRSVRFPEQTGGDNHCTWEYRFDIKLKEDGTVLAKP